MNTIFWEKKKKENKIELENNLINFNQVLKILLKRNSIEITPWNVIKRWWVVDDNDATNDQDDNNLLENMFLSW